MDIVSINVSTGLHFINVLRTAFTPLVPQSVRTQSSRQYLFTLLGPTTVKAVRRTLMKLTPGFPRYSRGLRSWKIVIREYQNSCFKPKIG
jgi:hypothetical protein